MHADDILGQDQTRLV